MVPGQAIAVLGTGAEPEALAALFAAAGVDALRVSGPVAAARGRGRVGTIQLVDGAELACDVDAQGEPPGPAPELLRALGVGVDRDPVVEAFAPRVARDGATSVPGLFAAGEVARPVPAPEALAWGRRAGEAALG